MEPIKIVDKLTLRQEALRLSVATGTNFPISQAKQYEAYLSGDAELPERDNSMEKYLGEMKDMLTKQHNLWISVDSEIKPAQGVEVVCALRYGSKIEYALMTYDNESKKWFNGDDDGNTAHVVAFMAIPEYRPL